MTKAIKAARERTVASKGGRKLTRSSASGEIISRVAGEADPDRSVSEVIEPPLSAFLRKYKLPKVPKNPGAMADQLYTLREDRLKLSKIVDAMETQEKALKRHFIDNLSKKDSTGVAGKVARVQIGTEDQPAAEDWEKTYAYIKKTGSFDLLNRALNRTAVRARWEAGKEVPGVGHFPVTKVSVTKI